ncbi:phage shock envelope stress response protein PspM [Mycolicibacterium sp. 22603]|uniref:phage shock envelope stress response protein PspM n=1 Tax=Mycolicibacterium sp. 22603 TaxID=3453950 RepID=UPI003F851405
MAAGPRSGRRGRWRAVAERGLQGGIDTAAEFSGLLASKLAAMSDPRAKLLRKRRWAFRLGLFFALSSGFWILVTALLAVWSTPVWALIVTGVIAAGAAFPATLFFLRYRWLRAEPLPAGPTARRMPPWGSVARKPMADLASSERGLYSLLGVLQRSRMLPESELRDIEVAAGQTAFTMAATADEVVAMERTASSSPRSRAHLAPTIASFAGQLQRGAQQYDEMVTAAAQLVSSVNAGPVSYSPMARQRYRDELVHATDRLQGWAQAYSDLRELGARRGA